jgi:hypothetical protein
VLGRRVPQGFADRWADVDTLVWDEIGRECLGAPACGGGRPITWLERPVYDELMADQIATAQAGGEGELASLLGSGDTWSIT